MQLAQLSELPEDPRLAVALVLAYCASSVYSYHGNTIRVRTYSVFILSQRSVERVPQAFFTS